MGSNRTFQELIAQSKGLLLDFDGPVCDVFAGTDSAQIASDLAASFGFDIQTDDPLDLIREAIKSDGPVEEIHEALTRAEIEAVATATETPGIRGVIDTYRGPIAIVSNNATEAIDMWLTDARLRDHIDAIVGRSPWHMKPDTHSLVLAAEAIERPLQDCVFLGDSLSDIQAGRDAGSTVIALANRPDKRPAFEETATALTIDSIPAERMPDAEIETLFRLLKKYVEEELDQWANFKFDTEYGDVFVMITRHVSDMNPAAFDHIKFAD